ncbi:hypothetical protein PG987_000306 [Apiospora arundinis]
MPSFTPIRAAAQSALRLASTPTTRTLRTSHPAATTLLSRRPLSTTPTRLAYKDDQDRRSLKPRAHEYTGSGSDEEAAHNADSAFNPDKTRPEQERTTAGAGGKAGDNPLEVSPANHEVSKGGQGAMEDKPQQGHKSNKSTSSTAAAAARTRGAALGRRDKLDGLL